MENISSKCQNCGSELWYNPKQRCLTCNYCKSNYFLPKKADDAVLVRQYNAGFHPNQLNRSLTAYKCDTCQNVYYMSSEEKSKKCINCGNSSSVLVEDSMYSADGIIPFKISKEEAAKHFEKYLKTKSNVPGALKKLAKNNKLMGMFVPVWNFSFNVESKYTANTLVLRKDHFGSYYSVTKPISGEDMQRIASLDELANKNESELLLELFDENDYAEIIPYFPEYTYGYRVNSVNKNIHDFAHDIISDAEKKQVKAIKKQVVAKHKDISDVNVDSEAKDVFFNFTYVPVYVNAYTHKGKTYKTYINGTTGKVVGETPKSMRKVFGKFLEALIIAGLIGLGIYLFLL